MGLLFFLIAHEDKQKNNDRSYHKDKRIFSDKYRKDGEQNSHRNIHHCITFASKAHIIGEFLLRTNRRDIQIMGYDILKRNAECLRRGSISFLISQHAFQQGFYSVDALFQAIALKKEVNPVNYMPIELISKENIDYYRRKQL